jgi:hypothetical protein
LQFAPTLGISSHHLQTPDINTATSTGNQDPKSSGYFNIPSLDHFLSSPGPPTLEFISPPSTHHPSGAGKTSLLYLIIAYAVLPSSLYSISVGGHDAATILLDPLHHFSASRLASVMFSLLSSKLRTRGRSIDETAKQTMKEVVQRSLIHVHIFRPQSWGALLSTLKSLPDYLFDATRHKSMHRRIHSTILEDVDAFVWSIRNNPSTTTSSNPLATASTQLTTQLSKLAVLLSCATITTSYSSSNSPTIFRPHLPTAWPQGTQITRLAVSRVEVLRFAPAVSIEEAEAERQQRWEVVNRGQFECWKVGPGVRDGEGFVFRVAQGVEVEGSER